MGQLYDVCVCVCTYRVVVQHELDRTELNQLPHTAVCAENCRQGEQHYIGVIIIELSRFTLKWQSRKISVLGSLATPMGKKRQLHPNGVA